MYVEAISQLDNEGTHFVGITLFHNGNQANTYAELVVINDDTGENVKPTEQELSDAYDRWLIVDAEQAEQQEASRITREDVKQALINELVKGTPVISVVHTEVRAFVEGNARLINAHQNTADLFGYDTSTPIGYVQAAYLLMSLTG